MTWASPRMRELLNGEIPGSGWDISIPRNRELLFTALVPEMDPLPPALRAWATIRDVPGGTVVKLDHGGGSNGDLNFLYVTTTLGGWWLNPSERVAWPKEVARVERDDLGWSLYGQPAIAQAVGFHELRGVVP